MMSTLSANTHTLAETDTLSSNIHTLAETDTLSANTHTLAETDTLSANTHTLAAANTLSSNTHTTIAAANTLSVNMHILAGAEHESSSTSRSRYIYGLGGVAREIADIFNRMNDTIAGFVVDSEYISQSPAEILNVPVISFDEYAALSTHTKTAITVSLGEPLHRKRLSEKLAALNLTEGTITLCDYLASDSSVETGTILHAGSVVSSRCTVGKSCLINKRVIIGHDSTIGDYSVMSPCVVTGGHVSIGNNCFVGLGACIRDRVKIGNDVIIGMGAVVTHDIGNSVIVYGNPARVIRQNLTHKVFA